MLAWAVAVGLLTAAAPTLMMSMLLGGFIIMLALILLAIVLCGVMAGVVAESGEGEMVDDTPGGVPLVRVGQG